MIRQLLQFVYKSLTSNAPAYIDDLLSSYNPPRKLWSYNSSLLIEPISKHSWGDRSFSHAAPCLWNKLPALVKSSVSLTQFKKQLKTHLFKQAILIQWFNYCYFCYLLGCFFLKYCICIIVFYTTCSRFLST